MTDTTVLEQDEIATGVVAGLQGIFGNSFNQQSLSSLSQSSTKNAKRK